MTTMRLSIIFASLVVMYSLLLIVGYRPLTRPSGLRFFHSTAPVETTSPEEQSRDESSFIIREERRIGTTRGGFFVLAIVGYIALLAGFAAAFMIHFRSAHV